MTNDEIAHHEGSPLTALSPSTASFFRRDEPSFTALPGEGGRGTQFHDDDDDDGEDYVREFPLMSSYELYCQRWLVLASYCLLNLSNGWSWVTWSPLTALLAEHWDVTEGAVDALSGIFMFVFVPVNVLAMWLVVNHLGLARGLFIGALLNTFGLGIRYGAAFLANGESPLSEYQIVFVGTFLCALAQTFILPMVALLSGSWFGELERATATSLGTLAYQSGCLIGLGSTVAVDFRTDDDGNTLDGTKLAQYLQLQWILSLLALVMVAMHITGDRPPTPPSEAAATLARDHKLGKTVKYRASIALILEHPSSRLFFLLFGTSIGVFYAIPTFLSQFMPDWEPHMQGWLGGIFQIAAVLGCFAAGHFVAWFQMQYKKVCLVLLGGCFVSVVLYLVAVYYQSSLALVVCGGLGFFFSCFMSVGIEYGTALTFPADEAAVYGILDSTGELCGFFLVALGGYMSRRHELVVPFCGIMVGLIAIALILLWRLEGLPRRPSSIMTSAPSSFMSSTSFLSPTSSFVMD